LKKLSGFGSNFVLGPGTIEDEILMGNTKDQKGGIYIHVPFCVKKCDYCDFYSRTDLERIPIFIDSLVHEMEMRADIAFDADTLYFGGGTPSLLEPKQIQDLMKAVGDRFQLSENTEITIEANPGTVTAEKLAGFRQVGVNRINIGIQSFSDFFLGFLSRIHTANQAIASIASARSAGSFLLHADL
jgi:oxygen-independent coproporphyrinogen-3 oxidase